MSEQKSSPSPIGKMKRTRVALSCTVVKKERTHDERVLVLGFRKIGMSFNKVSRLTGIPLSTVKSICWHHGRTGEVDASKRSGRPRILSPRASRRLKLVTRKDRKQSLLWFGDV